MVLLFWDPVGILFSYPLAPAGRGGRKRIERLRLLQCRPLPLARPGDTRFSVMSWYSIPIHSPVSIDGRRYSDPAPGWDSSLAVLWPDTTTGFTLSLASVWLLGRLRSSASLT